MLYDTIAAIATPLGVGAVSLLRVSGPGAEALAEAVFRGRAGGLRPRVQHFGQIVDAAGAKVDDVLLTFFPGPGSYTGEPVVEIGCHGGVLVTRRVLGRLLEAGARLAEPGEFTRRAFLNGRMDLTQAEAVMDLINARTDLALRAAADQLEGRLGERVGAVRELLLDLLAHVEAYIDFPEEDIDPETGAALLVRLDSARGIIAELLATAGQGRILREGVRTVIYGRPNVGKSSLLNRLLGVERAIVSATPGTTRDTIEEVINLRGLPLRLVDTAGVRATADALEEEGIARTRRNVEQADLVLHVVDASAPPEPEDAAFADARALLVLNKVDLGVHPGWEAASGVRLSCASGSGLEALGEAIFERAMGGGPALGDAIVAINARHQACLRRAATDADAARAALEAGLSSELVAVDLRAALDAIGEIVGRADTEEVLGRIFATFCLGK